MTMWKFLNDKPGDTQNSWRSLKG